jgi:DNA-binding NarL/FixJ family response regulator
MTIDASSPGDGAVPTAELPALMTIASSATMRRRIGTAVAHEGLRIEAEAGEPSAAVDGELEGLAVIVFNCDVDASREIAALRRLCKAVSDGPAVVVISPPSTGMGVRRALDAGAHGVVFEPEMEVTLATAIHAVAIGQAVVPRKLRASFERPALSHREGQVLSLVCEGLTNAEIAERLFLAESTVKSHLSSIFAKFGVRSRKEIVAALCDPDLDLNRIPVAVGDQASG